MSQSSKFTSAQSAQQAHANCVSAASSCLSAQSAQGACKLCQCSEFMSISSVSAGRMQTVSVHVCQLSQSSELMSVSWASHLKSKSEFMSTVSVQPVSVQERRFMWIQVCQLSQCSEFSWQLTTGRLNNSVRDTLLFIIFKTHNAFNQWAIIYVRKSIKGVSQVSEPAEQTNFCGNYGAARVRTKWRQFLKMRMI